MPEVVGVILELFALSAENYVVFLSQVWRGWASFGDMRVFYVIIQGVPDSLKGMYIIVVLKFRTGLMQKNDCTCTMILLKLGTWRSLTKK